MANLRTPAGKVINLKKGLPAPYDGALANEPAYRFYVNQSDLYMMCSQSLQECDDQNKQNSADLFSVKTLIAFGLGALTVYLVRK